MPEEKQEFNPLVRIANVDIKGEKALLYGLTRIKGVSFSFATAVCNVSGLDRTKKIGYLDQKEIEQLVNILENPKEHGFPLWMLNRLGDYETGEDKHLLTGDIKFTKDNDIRRLQRIKSRRGLRHAWKLPVRGQRTKGNFRKGSALGVKRKKGK
jgi:small subunit ribosomal protein S13